MREGTRTSGAKGPDPVLYVGKHSPSSQPSRSSSLFQLWQQRHEQADHPVSRVLRVHRLRHYHQTPGGRVLIGVIASVGAYTPSLDTKKSLSDELGFVPSMFGGERRIPPQLPLPQ